MLTGYNLVYFGPEKWDGLWRNRHQLMSRFAQSNKVLYVEPKIYLQKVRRQLGTGNIQWQDFKQNRVTRAGDNLYIYHNPAFIPISGRYPLDRITWFFWKKLLRSTMQKLGFDEPIIWLSKPSMVNLIGAFDEKLTIYHVVDEYLSYCRDDVRARMRQQNWERHMLEKADLAIVVSENLLQAKRPLNKHTQLVTNGVDYQAYVRAADDKGLQPPDIAPLPKPIIGYSGLIASKLDLDLLQYIATTQPEWSLALVGAVDDRYCLAELTRLRQIKNVYFLGRKEINQVPHYVQAFDVCLIPYQINERAQNASPLKLYDYLATGKPIVTTDFAAADLFKQDIRIARNHKEFIGHIKEALLENDQDLSSRRQGIAAENAWEKKMDQLSRIIQSHLGTNEQKIESERK